MSILSITKSAPVELRSTNLKGLFMHLALIVFIAACVVYPKLVAAILIMLAAAVVYGMMRES